MADVALVLDNADGLVPVDYAVVEVGRRLFRSGENEYLVNRQRVRLRDLVELLDSAHLADNAFLFIGQGMVDQALALRPEERRPLFEEVAGVRRHERRRRRAEEQLEEATANLARVEDILAELRPQVRRLAAQAEQQASRARAGDELALALVGVFGSRWHDGRPRGRRGRVGADRLRGEPPRRPSSPSRPPRAVPPRPPPTSRRTSPSRTSGGPPTSTHRTALAALDLEAATATAEASADRSRPGPPRGRADRGRSGAGASDGASSPSRSRRSTLRSTATWRRWTGASPRRARRRARCGPRPRAARRQNRPFAGPPLRAPTRSRPCGGALAGADETLAARRRPRRRRRSEPRTAAAALESARETLAAIRLDEEASRDGREVTRLALAEAEAGRQGAAEAAGAARSRLATLRGRADALRARVTADEGRGIAPSARRAGGRALVADLEVDPALRPLVAGGPR